MSPIKEKKVLLGIWEQETQSAWLLLIRSISQYGFGEPLPYPGRKVYGSLKRHWRRSHKKNGFSESTHRLVVN